MRLSEIYHKKVQDGYEPLFSVDEYCERKDCNTTFFRYRDGRIGYWATIKNNLSQSIQAYPSIHKYMKNDNVSTWIENQLKCFLVKNEDMI